MSRLYDFGIRLYWLSILIASIWDSKARLWLKGRRNWHQKIRQQFKESDRVVWFHCASLGEFEQGRPVIEKMRKEQQGIKILLTFSSPSGYEKRKNYEEADFVSYLPLDTAGNARRFVESVPLVAAVFVKYEFWFHYLKEVRNSDIPLFLISAIFRERQLFFRWYGSWYRSFLYSFSHIFVQEEESGRLLNRYGLKEVTVAGDTRFDRVVRVLDTAYSHEAIGRFTDGARVIIAGSTWENDEQLLADVYNRLSGDIKWIIVPHEIGSGHIRSIQKLFPESVLFTDLREMVPDGIRVIIVNTIGQLSYLYRFGSLAYIGGGFGRGIHNILEAATYGLPVIFGPQYHKFSEAVQLVSLQGAFPVNDSDELLLTINQQLENKKLLKTSSDICKKYVKSMVGATSVIYESMCKKIGLNML